MDHAGDCSLQREPDRYRAEDAARGFRRVAAAAFSGAASGGAARKLLEGAGRFYSADRAFDAEVAPVLTAVRHDRRGARQPETLGDFLSSSNWLPVHQTGKAGSNHPVRASRSFRCRVAQRQTVTRRANQTDVCLPARWLATECGLTCRTHLKDPPRASLNGRRRGQG